MTRIKVELRSGRKNKNIIPSTQKFRATVLSYYKKEGRKLPWRRTKDPYKILVSEIMLQQTQAGRVVEKYNQFIKLFPNFSALARASLPKVLKQWQGLGYNRRALYLKHLAEKVVSDYQGKLPNDDSLLVHLPGIGAYTAAAIMAFAFNQPMVFIETNIRTVFIHFFFHNKEKINDKDILPFIRKTVDKKNPREWYWALMDYGAMLKSTGFNHAQKGSSYVKQSPFKNSDRQLRGEILRLLLKHKKLSFREIVVLIKTDKGRLKRVLEGLKKEGIIVDKIINQHKFFTIKAK